MQDLFLLECWHFWTWAPAALPCYFVDLWAGGLHLQIMMGNNHLAKRVNRNGWEMLFNNFNPCIILSLCLLAFVEKREIRNVSGRIIQIEMRKGKICKQSPSPLSWFVLKIYPVFCAVTLLFHQEHSKLPFLLNHSGAMTFLPVWLQQTEIMKNN